MAAVLVQIKNRNSDTVRNLLNSDEVSYKLQNEFIMKQSEYTEKEYPCILLALGSCEEYIGVSRVRISKISLDRRDMERSDSLFVHISQSSNCHWNPTYFGSNPSTVGNFFGWLPPPKKINMWHPYWTIPLKIGIDRFCLTFQFWEALFIPHFAVSHVLWMRRHLSSWDQVLWGFWW